MMLSLLLAYACVAPLVSAYNARSPIPLMESLVAVEAEGSNFAALPPLNTTYYFDQLIDHQDPSKGTFKQRYWHSWQYYKPGGPIVLSTPGEANAEPYTGYLTNLTINGAIAQEHGGATIVLEHRFFGLSNPYPDLTVQSLQVHNLQQSVDDLEYFAKNVKLPMPGGDEVAPGKAPWVLTGGSYSGALTAWTMVKKPGLFQAGWSSSGVVQTIGDFWRYFEPIREHMPANCSADVQAVIAHFDENAANATAFDALKAKFGLEELEHVDDVTATLKVPIYTWQSLQPSSGSNTSFFEFCDALEVKDGESAPASGWGVEHALDAWGALFKDTDYLVSNGCSDGVSFKECFDTYDASSNTYTNTSIDNSYRSWFWFVCNEVGWFQDSAPDGHPTLVSRTLKPSNQELRQCQLFFPDAFPSPPVLEQYEATDATYGGWDLDVPNLFFANGQRDPWRDATVSAEGVTPAHTPQEHIGLHDAFHTSDLRIRNNVDASIAAVQKQGLRLIGEFLSEWKPSAGVEVDVSLSWKPTIKRDHY